MKALAMKIDPDGRGYCPCDPSEATHIRIETPGPFPTRILPIRGRILNGPTWEWDFNQEEPTLSPSILTWVEYDGKKVTCHSFVRKGMIEFLPDSTHEFAGKTVPLLDIDL